MIDFFGEGKPALSRTRSLTIVAQDPTISVSSADPRILTGVTAIPNERFLPGPRGSRFHVVDIDLSSGKAGPASVMADGADPAPDPVALAAVSGVFDAQARAQNLFGVAARTLARFEQDLGRRVPWSFDGHQLYLVPEAMAEAQAYYDPPTRSILFGAYGGDANGKGRVFTALSHDVVAHETTHAILDGLRHRFTEPALPDQLAFHEAFADIVALLSVFSLKGVPARLLDRVGVGDWLPSELVTDDALARSPLFGLAEQLGTTSPDHHGDALRRSVSLPPLTTYLADPAYQEAHARGEILVAAVARTFLLIWSRRLETLHQKGMAISADRAAEEGAKSAEHLLTMCIRAIDWTPPIDLAFGDFLDGILAADRQVAPDDEHDYRGTLAEAFASYGITGSPAIDVDTSTPAGRLDYAGLHLDELKTHRDEVFHFIWDNATALGLHTDYYLSVESVVPARRVGPDGFVVYESAAAYVQLLDGPVANVAKLAESQGKALRIPEGLDPSTRIQIQGGGALIFDEFGRAKAHQRKAIFDWDRQSDRLASLVARGIVDSRGQFGFSSGRTLGEEFRLLHRADDDAERW